jgi:hypothetical protein
MAEFVIGTDVVTAEPTVEVTVSANRPLGVGRHTFQLIVVDDSGNVSAPDRVVVIVADQDAPTAVISAPEVVPSGRSFTLDGRRSFDTGGGRVVSFRWTLVG